MSLKTYLESLLQNVENGVAVTAEHIKDALSHFDSGIQGVIVEPAADATVDAAGVTGIPGVPTEIPAAAEAPAPAAQS